MQTQIFWNDATDRIEDQITVFIQRTQSIQMLLWRAFLVFSSQVKKPIVLKIQMITNSFAPISESEFLKNIRISIFPESLIRKGSKEAQNEILKMMNEISPYLIWYAVMPHSEQDEKKEAKSSITCVFDKLEFLIYSISIF